MANVSQASSGAKLSIDSAEAAGAAAVILPVAALLAAAAAMERLLMTLKRDRSLDAIAPDLMPMSRYHEVVGLSRLQADEDRYGTTMQHRNS